MPECFRLARPRAVRGQGVSGIQCTDEQRLLSDNWIPPNNARE